MARILIFIITIFPLISCISQKTPGSFTIDGQLKNAPDQQVFLEQIYFNQDPPQVVDTAEMVKGKFELETKASEEGLYRIRFEKNAGYLFINDRDEIKFKANANDSILRSSKFNTPANASLTRLIIALDSIHSNLISLDQQRKNYLQAGKDSLVAQANNQFNAGNERYKTFLINYIDTTSSASIALFALSYTQEVNIETVKKMVEKLQGKFPENSSVSDVKKQVDQFIATQQAAPTQGDGVMVGEVAPDFTLPDAEGNPFTLSSLRGKYVLIDFWASWCGPCRQENPNVVANYKEFKDKNFTILGVSLDKDKANWLKAIEMDNLTWKQVSDLKFWNSEAAALYNITAIPYNILIDPAGKVVAINLRGDALHNTLQKVL